MKYILFEGLGIARQSEFDSEIQEHYSLAEILSLGNITLNESVLCYLHHKFCYMQRLFHIWTTFHALSNYKFQVMHMS